MLFFPLIHVKMPTFVGILTFMNGKNFMHNCVEHEKGLITSGPSFSYQHVSRVLHHFNVSLQKKIKIYSIPSCSQVRV